MKTKDLRRHQRFEHRAKIQVCSHGETIIAYTKDLSDKGLFVIGQFPEGLALGDTLDVTVLGINDAVSRPVIVKRIEPGVGIGVEFVET